MYRLTPALVRDITGGEVFGTLPDAEIVSIETDSRKIVPGCLFAAMKGATFDGNDFVASAGEKGAICALCSRFSEAEIAQIRVPDTGLALQQIAAWYRAQFDFPFVGVTGSVGKTTAKEMIASVLSQRFNTLYTEKNFNNELGVPLTLFRLTEEHEAAVLEMGISGFGEMTRLGNMVHPDIAVYTLIGDAHLEFLGDRPGVLRAKGELTACMPENGLVIANGDDELLRGHDFGKKTILFGTGENCDVRASDMETTGEGVFCVITYGDRRIPAAVPEVGAHLVYATLMGAAVGFALGLTDEEIARGIAAYHTVGSRSHLINCGNMTVLDDCYNANPTSMRSALDTLKGLPGRHIAVLGDMLELGKNTEELHRTVGQYAAETGALVIACGTLAKHIAEGAGESARWFRDTEALKNALPELLQSGDSVLFKASHAMGFEALVSELTTRG